MPLTVLHVSPHPDDESLGAVGTLLALRAAGHRVVNFACGLGRDEHQHRRLAELREACGRAHFELRVADPLIPLSRGDDLARSAHLVAQAVEGIVAEVLPDPVIIVSPSPHDGHHGHEAVGRGVRDALARHRWGATIRWWMWGLWAELPLPTLFSPFDAPTLAAARTALHAHAGELERNDYDGWLQARAVAGAIAGSERVFGWGTTRRPEAPYADLLTEAWHGEDGWIAAAPRVLDAAAPLDAPTANVPLGWWLDEPSFRTRLDRARGASPPT